MRAPAELRSSNVGFPNALTIPCALSDGPIARTIIRRDWFPPMINPAITTLSPVCTRPREEILTAIRTSRFRNGLPYDPTRTALLEDSQGAMQAQPRDFEAKATILQSTNTAMDIQTSSVRPSFLVTSDIYYPGWRAYVDGAPAQLFVANYAFRGVKLPAGQHKVRFEFAPRRCRKSAVREGRATGGSPTRVDPSAA